MIKRMLYRQYKTRYADCKTIYGSYDPNTKTIEIDIPEGREKPSGVRGKRYSDYRFNGIETETNRAVTVFVKAVSIENALKRLPREYPTCIFTINQSYTR